MAQQLTMPAHKVIVCNALSVDELALVEPLVRGTTCVPDVRKLMWVNGSQLSVVG